MGVSSKNFDLRSMACTVITMLSSIPTLKAFSRSSIGNSTNPSKVPLPIIFAIY